MSEHWVSNSDENHINRIILNTNTIIDSLPATIQIIIKTLKNIVMNYLIRTDNSFTLNVADEEMSDSEYYSVLRTIAANMEKLKNNSHICQYFHQEEKTFQETIWSAADLNIYLNNIIDFIAAAQTGHINKTALKSILTSLIQSPIGEDIIEFNKTENIIIYSSKNQQCGILKLQINGYQKFSQWCCFTGAETKTYVKKTLILFRDSKDLLHTLKTFVQANRSS